MASAPAAAPHRRNHPARFARSSRAGSSLASPAVSGYHRLQERPPAKAARHALAVPLRSPSTATAPGPHAPDARTCSTAFRTIAARLTSRGARLPMPVITLNAISGGASVASHELDNPALSRFNPQSGFTGGGGHRTGLGSLPATCCIFARPPAFAPLCPADDREPSAASPGPAIAFSIAAAHILQRLSLLGQKVAPVIGDEQRVGRRVVQQRLADVVRRRRGSATLSAPCAAGRAASMSSRGRAPPRPCAEVE